MQASTITCSCRKFCEALFWVSKNNNLQLAHLKASCCNLLSSEVRELLHCGTLHMLLSKSNIGLTEDEVETHQMFRLKLERRFCV